MFFSAPSFYANGGDLDSQEDKIMKAPKKLAVMVTIILGIMPTIAAAQALGPLPVLEQEPGLLSQANTAPAFARLAAFGVFPGARLVAAEIRRRGDRLVYFFNLKFPDREGHEQVQVDAATGQVCCIEYSVERNPRRHLAITAPSALVSLVKLSFEAAREAASATVEHGHVLGCKLRVEQAKTVYVFDLDVGDAHALKQALIDANTGAVIAAVPPR